VVLVNSQVPGLNTDESHQILHQSTLSHIRIQTVAYRTRRPGYAVPYPVYT
jgi:hypothetical protein